jgi:hypothetical protein
MNAVIIICDDPRINLVKEAIQPLLITRISVVTNFDTGINLLFEKQPLVVFIQDEIGGVKGETVRDHVTSLFQSNSPRFITLDRADFCSGLVRNFSDGINLNLPVKELVAVFMKHLQRITGIRWAEAFPPSPVAGLPDSLHNNNREGLLFPAGESPAPEIPVTAATKSSQPDSSTDVIGMTIPPFHREADPTTTVRRWFRRGKILKIAALTLLVYGVISCNTPPDSGLRNDDVICRRSSAPPVSLPPVIVKPSTDNRTVPSFIHPQWLDPTFGPTGGGWERYCSPRLEFFVFREQGIIRIILIVALREGALTRAFVSGALRELCGATLTESGSRSVRGDYLVHRRKSSTGAEVLFYRKNHTGGTLGVVMIIS